ncbi:MAG TPA: NADP-dependent oxidoreductase [Polyangiaceae bacterium]|jgi:NADPH:quinone reductase-like Zn-dependent oxidoreductase
MKAFVLTGYGDIGKLEFRDVPDPKAEPGAIVVRMAGSSINPIDWKMRSGVAKERFPVQFPGILGRDASGEVIELGAGVDAFAVGDKVLGLAWQTYAERVAAPVEAWTKLPAGLDVVDAGALPLILLTGAQLAEEAVRPARGDVVLVTGAVGSVGRAALFGARAAGATVWAGVRRSQVAEAKTLGASGVVALDDEASWNGVPRFDAIADTVGGETVKKLYDRLKPGGVIGSVLGEPAGARERGFTVRAFTAHPSPATLSKYATAVAKGELVVPIAKRFPLARADEAQAFAEKGKPAGKVVLVG